MSTNMNDLEQTLLLLQINDTQFPIGSYSHSYGLESYIQERTISDEVQAKTYLKNYLEGTFFYNDLMAAYHGYIATENRDLEKIIELNTRLRASKAQKELREASEKLGSRLLRTVEEMDIDLGDFYKEIIDAHKDRKLNIHHSVAYGMVMAILKIDIDKSLLSYGFNTAASMTSNGVKTIPISQFSGQRILSEIHQVLIELVKKIKQTDWEYFGVSFPGVELASMRHEELYSRLYMS